MESAKDRRDDREYTALQVSQLDAAHRRALKPHLRCLFCQATAHFRSASRPSQGRRGRVAHFYSRPHGDECDITRSYGDPWESEEGDRTVAHWEQRNITLIVRINSPTDEVSNEDNEEEGLGQDEARSRSGGERTLVSSSVSRGPQKLLEQLVHWPTFKTSTATLRMPDPDRAEMVVHDAFVRFESASAGQHTARWHGFWGIVRPLSYWAHGDTWFSNFGAFNSSFRISIHRTQVPDILRRYGLARIEDLSGHYLLLFDLARESTSGRFIADINSINHIGLLAGDSAP